MNRYERFWDLPVLTPASEVEDDFNEPFVDPALDTRGILARGKSGRLRPRLASGPSGAREERAILHGCGRPRLPGAGHRPSSPRLADRAGPGVPVVTCDPALPWYIRTWNFDWVDDSFRLYRRFGAGTGPLHEGDDPAPGRTGRVPGHRTASRSSPGTDRSTREPAKRSTRHSATTGARPAWTRRAFVTSSSAMRYVSISPSRRLLVARWSATPSTASSPTTSR